MSGSDIQEVVSVVPFEATLERLSAAITRAGLILFNRIDHQAGAREAGLEMPPTTVLTYGHPKGGTPIMLAAPLAALDLPLRVLVRVRDDGQTAIAFHSIGAALRRARRQAGARARYVGESGDGMSATLTLVAPGKPALDYLPVGLFGSVMVLTGLSVAWKLASARYGAPESIALVIAALAVLAFAAMLVAYAWKAATSFGAVKSEFRHRIAGNLFGTILISLLLLPIIFEPFAHRLAQIVWIVGAVGQFLFSWLIISRWMSDRQQVAHATPPGSFRSWDCSMCRSRFRR